MSNRTLDFDQGHWILAKMGKRVLRPGGKELTMKLIENMSIQNTDEIVEFAPGLGYTASVALQRNPKSYTGVELNEEAASILSKAIIGKNGYDRRIVIANAANSTLSGNSYDKVYGEAMLTIQADHRKSEIIKEAYRILKPGALYGIHELGLTPDNLNEDTKAIIQRELAQTIKVNARPLTISEWTKLLENEGFKVVKIETNSMSLLELKRMIDDEGFLRTLKITFNILIHSKERKRILAMRETFRKYKDSMNAVVIIAQKN